MKRESLIGIGSVAAIAVAVVIGVVLSLHVERPTAPPSAAAPQATAAPAAPSKPTAEPRPSPSFDVVRVSPDGQAVIAGRAAPGAQVTVLDHGKAVGNITADPNGEWVLVPSKPLAPGTHELSLAVRPSKGGQDEHSGATVAVMVPERQQPAVAVLLPKDGEGVAQPLQPAERRSGHGLTLDLLQYDAKGRLSLAGRAPPGAKVDIYLNDRLAGHAAATGEGKWTTTLGQAVPVGPYHLRLDATGAHGKRVAELDMPLERVAPGVLATSGTFVTVQPGNSLWRIARRTYGHGTRYVEIYRANTERISDPDLIYPGEVLAVPPSSHAASAAAATSSSR